MAVRQFGPYRLAKLLGRGGMGEVYLAYDGRHQRAVAIKLLLESLSADPEYRSRFEREAQIVAGLREQHVIPIHNYGEIDGRLYIDMRLVDGEDLGSLLTREHMLDPHRAVRVVAQVAAALDAAHMAGLVHRDVKPANVLIANTTSDRNDSVYLADFGIARMTTSKTRLTLTGAAVGTPDYMAPERFTTDRIDYRADIYALGCMLFEMLCGRKPFPGDDYPTLIYQHLNSEPPMPSAERADLPSALDNVIATSMAKDPRARYSSAGELATAADLAIRTVIQRSYSPSLTWPASDAGTVAPTSLKSSSKRQRVAARGSDSSAEWRVVAAGCRWPRWFYEVDPAGSQIVGRAWPTATDYAQAVQARDAPLTGSGLRDARLVRDNLGMPASSSGQNAVVFEFSHPGGQLALRCFTRSPSDASARYRALAPALVNANCDVVAPARWVNSAIEVAGESWPAVVMPWVPGLPLNTRVEIVLNDRRGLRELAESWRTAVSDLAGAGLAHGDLQSGNILVDERGELHLVDLDGFYVPAIGRPPGELGHPDFQHPRRTTRDWGPDIDAFSILVIDLSLRALESNPGLWQFNSAENLILAREDYEQPGRTPVWRELRASLDPEVVQYTDALADFCAASALPTVSDVLALLDSPSGPMGPPYRAPLPPPALTPTRSNPAPGERWWADDGPEIISDPLPPVRPTVGGILGRNAVIIGLSAGLICATLIVAIYAMVGRSIPLLERAPLLVGLAGTVLTAGLIAIPRATMGAASSALKLGLAGAVLGLALSLISLGGFELFAYDAIPLGRASLALVAAWALCAISIGVAAGIVRHSGRAVVSGVLGGAAGGTAAGFIHWMAGPEFVPSGGSGSALDIDVLNLPTLVAICLACAAIGLAIGLVDRMRRKSWLTVIEGRLRGREVILDRPEVTIGTDNRATLRLVGDRGVDPSHAILSGGPRGYRLLCHGRVEVNGSVCPPSTPVLLRSEDVLRIGGSFIRFEHRDER